MSFAADADATSITARKKKALDFVNKVKQESAMIKKKTEVKETEVQETKVKETEVKETEVKENEVKKSEVKETEVEKTKDEAAVEERMAAMAEELRAATAAIEELKLHVASQLAPHRPPCRHHAARRCWYGAAGIGCRFDHSFGAGGDWRWPSPPRSPTSPRPRPPATPPRTPVKFSPMLARSPAPEPRYTAIPRVSDIKKNTLGAACIIEDDGKDVCEDELAAAEVCKQLVDYVVQEEQKMYIQKMVGKATNLEDKYKARSLPSEDEDGVTRSPILPRIMVDFARVNPFALAKLPKPEPLPRQGCSQDADLYNKCTEHSNHKDCEKSPQDCRTKFSRSGTLFGFKVESGRHKGEWKTCTSWCFGTRAGFVTTLGVIALPTDPIHGYVYVGGYGKDARYVITAEAA